MEIKPKLEDGQSMLDLDITNELCFCPADGNPLSLHTKVVISHLDVEAYFVASFESLINGLWVTEEDDKEYDKEQKLAALKAMKEVIKNTEDKLNQGVIHEQ